MSHTSSTATRLKSRVIGGLVRAERRRRAGSLACPWRYSRDGTSQGAQYLVHNPVRSRGARPKRRMHEFSPKVQDHVFDVVQLYRVGIGYYGRGVPRLGFPIQGAILEHREGYPTERSGDLHLV